MKYEELISMVKEVSNLGVANFEYAEGDMRISLKFGGDLGGGPDGGQSSGSVGLSGASMGQNGVPMGSLVPFSGVSDNSASEQISYASAGNASRNSQSPASEGKMVKSPLVGTYYAAPSEDAEPFVKVGDRVKKGQVLAIVEAMKLMNEIESEYDGVIDTILVKNGEAVGYGQPMFKIL